MDEMFRIRSMAATFAHHDNNWIKMLVRALAEVERMRDERDEARRMFCENVAAFDLMVSPEQVADQHGWECFKNKEDDDDEQVHVD